MSKRPRIPEKSQFDDTIAILNKQFAKERGEDQNSCWRYTWGRMLYHAEIELANSIGRGFQSKLKHVHDYNNNGNGKKEQTECQTTNTQTSSCETLNEELSQTPSLV